MLGRYTTVSCEGVKYSIRNGSSTWGYWLWTSDEIRYRAHQDLERHRTHKIMRPEALLTLGPVSGCDCWSCLILITHRRLPIAIYDPNVASPEDKV